MNLKDEFCTALLPRANDFIKFPKTEAETRQSIQEFQDISRFPQVVGALDGSHIPIRAPKEDPNEYVNRKSFHSIVLQGVAGANGKFLHVSTGYAGSIHDARVLRMSSLLPAIENGDILHSPTRRIGGTQVKPLIIADPAYKLMTWCMKPFPQTRALTDSQRDSINHWAVQEWLWSRHLGCWRGSRGAYWITWMNLRRKRPLQLLPVAYYTIFAWRLMIPLKLMSSVMGMDFLKCLCQVMISMRIVLD